MKTQIITAPLRRFALLVLLLAAARVDAQFAIDWFTFDGGGRASSGGPYSLQGTLGQPDAGTSSGGGYTSQGGFWPGVTSQSAPALRILRDGTNVVLAWPNPSGGFQLQESSSLTTPDWANVNTAPVLVGDEKQVNQPVAAGVRFYRLRKL